MGSGVGLEGVMGSVFMCRSGTGHPQGEGSHDGNEAEWEVVHRARGYITATHFPSVTT